MRIIFCIPLLLISLLLSAQYREPYFNTLGVPNGLPEGNVLQILQDHLGYLWLGTQNGIIRYDGYSLSRFDIPDDQGNPIVVSSCSVLFEDSKKTLWTFGARDGIFYLDRKKNAFIKISLDTISQNIFKNTIPFLCFEDRVNNIFLYISYDVIGRITHVHSFDPTNKTITRYSAEEQGKYYIPDFNDIDMSQSPDGQIWMVTEHILHKFNTSTLSFDPWFTLPDTSGDIRFNTLLTDPADPDLVWISTANKSNRPGKLILYQLNTITKQHKAWMPDSPDKTSIQAECRQIMVDSLKRIWASSEKGLSLYNRASQSFIDYTFSLPPNFFGNKAYVATLAADPEGNLWMGGNYKGFNYMDITTGKVTYYPHRKEEGSLPDHNGIRRIFFDRSKKMWIDIPFIGIASLEHSRSLFNPISIEPQRQTLKTFRENVKFDIIGHYKDSLLFVRSPNEVFIWNYVSNTYTPIELPDPKLAGLIQYMCGSKDGIIWIGTSTTGLIRYDPRTKKTISYSSQPDDTTSISGNAVYLMVEDESGNLYVGTGGGGLCRFNKKDGKFSRLPFNQKMELVKAKSDHKNELDDAVVLSLFIDEEGIVWAGTNLGGLNKFDPVTGQFTSYRDLDSGLTCVTNIYKDQQGRVWAGTYLAGLFLIDTQTGSFKRYGVKEGLLHGFVVGIREDDAGNLWILTQRGLSKLPKNAETFINYPNPLQTIPLNGNMIKPGIQGQLNLLSENGLIVIPPGALTPNPIPPQVWIESVTYPNKKATATETDTLVYLSENDHLVLAYNENKIRFQYVALHFAEPAANQYVYKLDGYDEVWQQGGTQRSITYTNLSHGTYVFRVKASNSDGIWNEVGTAVTITILPPWWKTWWAYTGYVLLFLFALRLFSKWRERSLRQKNENLEQKVAERTNSLKTTLDHLQATQAQLIHAEKMASLGELTAGIAHEIQNPLNFINNFAEVNAELIDELHEGVDRKDLEEVKSIAGTLRDNEEKIIFHGKRADAIVKGMLQHSRSGSRQKEPTDINALADEYLRLAYHGLRAKDKSFNASMKTAFDDHIGKIDVIPQEIGRVILNLITNAFYAVNEKQKLLHQDQHADTGYIPTVTVTTRREMSADGKPGISLSVADNGPGIPQHALDKIFQPFFTTKPTGQGTGLGLSLSYDIIKAHGGEIRVETREGESTTFTITLPVKE